MPQKVSNFLGHVQTCLTPLFGQPIITSDTGVGKTFIKNFSIPIPSNIENINNVEFVAFITGADNKTINVRKASPNMQQTFEEF